MPQHVNRHIGSLALATLLLAGACTRQDVSPEGHRTSAPPTRGKIGMTCMDLTNPFFKLIANVMQEEAARYGYELIALSGELDAAKQNNQLSDFVAQRCAAIFLNPVDSQAAGEGVKRAHEAGIPVFTFDVQVTDETARQLVVSHVGSDNYQGGRLAGESMLNATGGQGKIVCITFPEVTSCILREKGFKDYLAESHSQLEIVAELSGKGNLDEGRNVAAEVLQSHPDIVGIFAVNDPSGLGAYAAVKKAGKEQQITIIAFDASPAGKQAVFEKRLFDSPQQFPRKMALGTVASFIQYLDGEEVPKSIFIPCAHYRYEDAVADPHRGSEQW